MDNVHAKRVKNPIRLHGFEIRIWEKPYQIHKCLAWGVKIYKDGEVVGWTEPNQYYERPSRAILAAVQNIVNSE